MAVSFVDEANTGNDSFVTSRSVTTPAAVSSGDVAVFSLQRWDSGGTFPSVTAPAGSVLRNTTLEGIIEQRIYLIYVDAESSFEFSWATQEWSSLSVQFFTGVDQDLTLSSVPFDVQVGSGTSVPSISVTTETDAGLSWNLFHDTSASSTVPTGYTESHDNNVYAACRKIATGSSETASGSDASASQADIIVSLTALAPATTSGQTVESNLLVDSGLVFNPTTSASSTVEANLLSDSGQLFETEVTSIIIVETGILQDTGTVFEPSVVNLLQEIDAVLLSVPGFVFNPTIVGGEAGIVSISITDEARANMLADRGLSEPQNLSVTDLMRIVLDDETQVLVTETEASAATHLQRYLIELRNI